MTDHHAAFERIVDAATPAPWLVLPDGGGLYRVEGDGRIVERALPEAVARYLTCLRTIADQIGRRSPTGPGRLERAKLARAFDEARRPVGWDWVFVAPRTEGASWYLHDSVTKIGAGTLACADAQFLDAAKHVLAQRLREGGRETRKAGDRRLVIPKRAAPSDPARDYMAFAQDAQPRHALSGRNGLDERTAAINQGILHHLDVAPEHRVLDIGCGDASLLATIAPRIAEGIGTVLTPAEWQKLVDAGPKEPNLSFVAASLDDLRELNGPFDRVIANGCIHFARTRHRGERVLSDLADLMPAGGKLWLGEIHARECRERVFISKIAALRHVKERHGAGFALAFARYLWRRRHRADVIVEAVPRDWWHITPADFPALATRCGFALEGCWTCLDMTGDTFYALQERYSCLLRKV